MSKTTDWFANSIKPTRVGVYQVKILGSEGWVRYSRWNGKCWSMTAAGASEAFAKRRFRSSLLISHWRGLDEKP